MNISFGVFAPPLAEQIGIPENIALSHLQTDADAVTRLLVRGMITDREGSNARKRILVAIKKLPPTTLGEPHG